MKVLIVLTSFFWSGMIFAISFIEAPLKFKAPLVTEKIALGIGQLVFHATNKVEWILSAIIVCFIFFLQSSLKSLLFFLIPILILSIQTVILYSVLDVRVKEILLGNTVEDSMFHLWYIILEILKLIALISSSIILIK